MEAFTLDTSGSVHFPTLDVTGRAFAMWSDLSPFVQGYVEALFASLIADLEARRDYLPNLNGIGASFGIAFSDLSPEVLALILRDCEAVRNEAILPDTADAGRRFWDGRQSHKAVVVHTGFGKGLATKYWPPLTPYLSDDGNVRLREGK